MAVNLDQLASVGSKVRTPLALCGLIVVVLYGIYRQILSLDIFSKVGETSTVVLIGGILDKLFWLAMVALVMGIASHVLVLILKSRARRRASVELIDARVINASDVSGYRESNDRDH